MTSSRISKLLFKRSKRKPKDSPYLLSPPELSRLQGLLSHPDFRASYLRCFEPLLENECGALVNAADPTAVMVALGRIKLLEMILTWPERLAALNKEYYDDRAKRDHAIESADPERSHHLGSPYYAGRTYTDAANGGARDRL